MRENRTSGSVRGALGNWRSYREIFLENNGGVIMREHLVKRNASYLFDPTTLKSTRIGDYSRLIQSRIGGNPFKLDPDGKPIRLNKNDIIWLMETGYGIYAKSKIVDCSETFHIKTSKEFNEFRKENDPYLQDKYWDWVCSKLSKAIKMNKALGVIFVRHQIVDNATHYYVYGKQGAQNDWITFTTNEQHKKCISDQSPINYALANKENSTFYSRITPIVKYGVSRIWQIPSTDDKDFDHYVPASIGAPGIFEENVVPTFFSINRAKSNRIPKEFIETAFTYRDRLEISGISKRVVDEWDWSIRRGRKYSFQKAMSEKIIFKVRNWPENEQRKFYFKVLKKAFKSADIFTLMEKQAKKTIENFTKDKLVNEIKYIRKKLVIDIEEMYQNVNKELP